MMKLLAFVLLAACATADTSSRVTRVFPVAIEATLPGVDKIGGEVRGALGKRATAELDLCVSTTGQVTKARLVTGSTLAAFDAALLRDVAEWRFAAMPGPSTLATCERTRVTYETY